MHIPAEPYLPDGQVHTILAGDGLRDYETALKKIGISIIYSEKAKPVAGALASHADLVAFPAGNGRFVLAPEQEALAKTLCKLGIHCSFGSALLNGYPQEAKYNAVKIGKTLICNPKTVDSSIFCLAKEEDCAIISCRQGYTKCSVCVINKDALLTDDPGIANAVHPFFDVLLVQKGRVRLSGYPYGFIRGCCGLIAPDTLLFVGDYKQHEDAERIFSFLRNHGIYPESLSSGPLTDIGSFMPVIVK